MFLMSSGQPNRTTARWTWSVIQDPEVWFWLWFCVCVSQLMLAIILKLFWTETWQRTSPESSTPTTTWVLLRGSLFLCRRFSSGLFGSDSAADEPECVCSSSRGRSYVWSRNILWWRRRCRTSSAGSNPPSLAAETRWGRASTRFLTRWEHELTQSNWVHLLKYSSTVAWWELQEPFLLR